MAKISLEKFTEEFNNLSSNNKIAIYNEYCSEHGDTDKMLYDFDEEFFEMAFGNDPIEAARATFFGNIQNWSDEYIRFNGYGNLESLSEYDAVEVAEDHVEEIYEYEDVWNYYIEEDEDEVDEDTYICPKCGHVFKQGEYEYNYDTAKLDFVCPECDWEGNEHGVKWVGEEDEEED